LNYIITGGFGGRGGGRFGGGGGYSQDPPEEVSIITEEFIDLELFLCIT